METVVRRWLQSLSLGTPQAYKSLVVLPIFTTGRGKFEYLTLADAEAGQCITITEVSTAGSVPTLLVVNHGRSPILLLDGEELAGAKQNRVLNTSILVKDSSETKVPVSCTEQGRWAYSSHAFEQSGNVMAHKARARKSRAVSESLHREGAFASDQGEVWDEIQTLASKAKASSPTSAMKDVFTAREEELRKCAEVFAVLPEQVGLMVLIDGEPAGCDLLSLPKAYSTLHPKLVRSYALEALLEPSGPVTKTENACEKANAFLREIAGAQESEFPSVGYGVDHRFTGTNLGGTALVHAEEVIHAAFFRLLEMPPSGQMASLQRRRRRFSQ